jgi:hypothetical protein
MNEGEMVDGSSGLCQKGAAPVAPPYFLCPAKKIVGKREINPCEALWEILPAERLQ